MELNESLITTTEGSDYTTEEEEMRDIWKEYDTAFENCKIIWKVGLAFTALGLIIITSTWVMFPKWRNYMNYLSWNQCFSTIVMSWLQASVWIEYKEISTMYIILGLSDYFEFVSMCWTVASAVLCYAQVVLVFDRNSSHKYAKVTLLCWGIPLILKGIIIAIDTYVDTEDDPDIIVPLVPIGIMALINIYCYVRVIVCIIKRKHDQRRKLREVIRTITTGFFLLFIFIFTFAMLMFLDFSTKITKIEGLSESIFYGNYKAFIIYLYITTVLSSMHGGVLAFAYVFAIRSTRNMYVERFYKKKRTDYSSDTTGTTINLLISK